MGELDGKVAVVTGGAKGIGLGIAQCLSRDGATVVIADIDQDLAERSAESLPGDATAIQHDVRDGESAVRLAERTAEQFGRTDVLVNNAGVGPNPGPVQDTTDEEYDRVMDINGRGVFLTTRAFVPGMIEQGGGRIINISSIVGQTGFAMVVPIRGVEVRRGGDDPQPGPRSWPRTTSPSTRFTPGSWPPTCTRRS